MKLIEQIDQDLKAAMKAKEVEKLSVLRMLKAALTNRAFEENKDRLEDGVVVEVIRRMVKQNEEAQEAFTKGDRSDLADKEKRETQLLQSYLPPAMDEAELKGIVEAAIKELGVSGPKAMGQVMKAVLEKVGGRADGKQISQQVKASLQ